MTTKILQLVNSAFFGIPQQVGTIDNAVSLLGLETISALVLGHSVFESSEALESSGLDLDALWRRSSACAAYARDIAHAERMDKRLAEQAFLGGLLHGVGHLVLAASIPDAYAGYIQRIVPGQEDTAQLQVDCFGTRQSEVGAYLIGIWGLPDMIVEAVALHEVPGECATKDFGVCGVVHVASCLAANPKGPPESDGIDRDYLERAGVTDRLPVWQTAIFEKD